MKELNLVIDEYDIVINYNTKELKDYLMSLDGIEKVSIDSKDDLNISISYNNSINADIILMEIEAYLNLVKVPSLISFDKHSKEKLNIYKIVSNICCEYCFKGAIEDLFNINGIEKIESNYQNNDKDKKDIITVYYNPKIINLNKMKKIEHELDI